MIIIIIIIIIIMTTIFNLTILLNEAGYDVKNNMQFEEDVTIDVSVLVRNSAI